MIKYRVSVLWRIEIDAVEIKKETESSVWAEGRRERKATAYHRYFDDYQSAWQFLVDRTTEKIARHKESIYQLESDLEELKKREFARPKPA